MTSRHAMMLTGAAAGLLLVYSMSRLHRPRTMHGVKVFVISAHQHGHEILHPSITAGTACVAFTMVLISEVMGRFLFYASYSRLGL